MVLLYKHTEASRHADILIDLRNYLLSNIDGSLIETEYKQFVDYQKNKYPFDSHEKIISNVFLNLLNYSLSNLIKIVEFNALDKIGLYYESEKFDKIRSLSDVCWFYEFFNQLFLINSNNMITTSGNNVQKSTYSEFFNQLKENDKFLSFEITKLNASIARLSLHEIFSNNSSKFFFRKTNNI